MQYIRAASGVVFVILFGILPLSAAQAACLATPGDVNESGATNVADSVCGLLVAVAQAGGGATPTCVGGQPNRTDTNCSGGTDVSDALNIVKLALSLPLDASIDSDANGCVDACETGPAPGCGDGTCAGAEDTTNCPADCTAASDLFYWFKATDIPGATDGQALAGWPDLSGSSRNGVQTTGARQPTYHATGNSLSGPVVRFDGVDDWFLLPGNPFSSTSTEWTVVAAIAAETPFGHVIGTGSGSSGFLRTYGGALIFDYGKASAKANNNSNGPYASGLPAISDGTMHVVSATLSPSDLQMHVDGVPTATAAGPENAHPYTQVGLGASGTSTPRDPFGGEIAEIRVYNRALSNEEREAIEAHFAATYGTPAGDPGQCGGSGLMDACGVCGGNGSACGAHLLPTEGRLWWLRASDAPEAVGGGVWAWPNAGTASTSGAGGASQATPTKRPAIVQNAIGGWPVVQFDGVDDRLDMSTNPFSGGGIERTVFAVMTTTDSAGHVIGTGSGGSGFLLTFGGAVIVTGGAPAFKANNNGSGTLVIGGSSIADGQPRLVTFAASPGFSAARIDGQLDNAQTGAATNPHGYTHSTLGASDGSASDVQRDPFAGQLAEVIIYDRELSDSERAVVEAYLEQKYGLTLSPEPGCDGVIGSGKAFDGCGICDGDDSLCAGVPTAGLEVWLRPHDIPLHGATSRSVRAWPEGLGQSIETSQTSTGSQPTASFAAGSVPVSVDFDGSNDRLDFSTNIFASSATPKTVFVTINTTDSAAHLIGTGSGGSGFLTTYGHGMTLSGSGQATAKANSNNVGLHLQSGVSVNDGTWRVLTGEIEAGASTVRVDGGSLVTSTSSLNPHGYTLSALGASGTSSQDPFDGQIGDVLVYDRILTPSERVAVETYLAAKYN